MSRHELCLAEKMNLIKEREVGLSHRERIEPKVQSFGGCCFKHSEKKI